MVCSLHIHLKTIQDQMGVIHGRQENLAVKNINLRFLKERDQSLY